MGEDVAGLLARDGKRTPNASGSRHRPEGHELRSHESRSRELIPFQDDPAEKIPKFDAVLTDLDIAGQSVEDREPDQKRGDSQQRSGQVDREYSRCLDDQVGGQQD